MGFDAGLYRYPKYKEKLTSQDYHYIEEYLYYAHNDWAQEHFKTANEYALYAIGLTEEESKTYIPPSQDAINFYIEKATPDEYGHLSIFEDMGYWCSNGSGKIYDWFQSLAKSRGVEAKGCGLTLELSLQDISGFALFCWEYINKHLPEPCIIDKVFKYIKPEDYDEEDEDTEYDIRLTHCDGIECTFENGVTKRFETNSEYSDFFMPKEYYDDWEMSGYINGLVMSLEILRSTDFDKQFIEYSGGW